MGDVIVDRTRATSAPENFSIYLHPEPARRLANDLASGLERGRAIDQVIHDDRWRVVRFAPLDVHIDSRLRVVQVVTSLQIGGAERIAVALAGELEERGLACRLVTLGRSPRRSFRAPHGTIDLSSLAQDSIARAAAAARVAREFNADVIHAHLLVAARSRSLARGGHPGARDRA